MLAQHTTTREERGQTIANTNGQVTRIDELLYIVKSQSGNGEYTINKIDGEWFCDCPDNTYRHTTCKHIHAVKFSLTIRAEVKVNRVIPEVNVHTCQYCNSENIVKNAIRHNQNGDIQRYLCKTCGKRFSINLGFQKLKATPQIVTSAMQLYFTGESFRNVQKFLKLQGINVDHSTILRWVKKYVTLMNTYLEKIKPNVSNTWRADEVYIKVKGNLKYLFAMMDDETRFWIAQEVADSKDKHDAKQLFMQARRIAKKQPQTIITDGLPTYAVSAKDIFPQSVHTRKITFDGKCHNNNKMERMNGEIRDREKTMRGLKKKQTPILQGYQLYHNYIRPHEALNGKTPADACGITIEGKNKWITLIQNAKKASQ
ncbi:MAG: IS6 family transposase [Candidatus Bathyarchaeota archaeon]|nr:IS6 family transposase [Candidatus Bathyarchaeota archaeon]